MDTLKEIINKLELRELKQDDKMKECIKHTIKILEDLIKNHSYMEWDNTEGERVVHTETIQEKIKELKITLTKYA
tara:strand:- start:118 stop:342 length:225 start_codon:yes stop_codon:yes gene_type:complete